MPEFRKEDIEFLDETGNKLYEIVPGFLKIIGKPFDEFQKNIKLAIQEFLVGGHAQKILRTKYELVGDSKLSDIVTAVLKFPISDKKYEVLYSDMMNGTKNAVQASRLEFFEIAHDKFAFALQTLLNKGTVVSNITDKERSDTLKLPFRGVMLEQSLYFSAIELQDIGYLRSIIQDLLTRSPNQDVFQDLAKTNLYDKMASIKEKILFNSTQFLTTSVGSASSSVFSHITVKRDGS